MTTVLEFFLVRFPQVPATVWRERFGAGKVWAHSGAVAPETPFRPLEEIHYRREVDLEPPVRTDLAIVYRDDHLLVIDKPPFLPVTPGGAWVRGCLLHLLLERTGEERLAPLHRLDRLTSGLVVLSRRTESRSHFARLFQHPSQCVEKTYTAVCEVRTCDPPRQAVLEHHVARSPERHWLQVVDPDRPPNARLELELLETACDLALYRVQPATGRKHQVRVQLAQVGLPVVGDPLYGSEPRHDPGDLERRLWLDAYRLTLRSFPGFDGGQSLEHEWVSSRPPQEMLRHAVEERDERQLPRC